MSKDFQKIGSRMVYFLACATVALGLLGWVGYRGYRHWQPNRLARQAGVFIEKGDFQNAALTARRALQINDKNVPATRAMAQLAEKGGATEAVIWWQRVVQLDPSSKNCQAWAATALRFGQSNTAEQALAMMKPEDQKSVDFHTTAGTAAMGLGKTQEAAVHFAEGVKLDPQNETCRYNDATLSLESNDPAKQKAAVATLETLTGSERFQSFAHRMLMNYFAAHEQLDAALAHARKLADAPGRIFRDRIMMLDLLHRTKSGEASAFLEKLRVEAADKPDESGEVLSWMNGHDLAAESIEYAKKLKPEVIGSAPVGSALAQAYFLQKNWPALRDLVRAGRWGRLEYLRLTYHARALKELGDENGFHAQWSAAVSAAVKRSSGIRSLVQTALTWGWEDEARELLWAVSEGTSERKYALGMLYQYYLGKKDTAGLLRVVARLTELEPGNDSVRNNFAMFSLLLKTNTDRAFTIARELWTKTPTNSTVASTYAYALHVRKRTDEALAVMEALAAKDLDDPSLATYYGILLAAKGQTEKASKFLDKADLAKLLPEEEELVAEARGQLH